MSKNKSKSGIAVIVILVLAILGIAAYVGYTYVQKDVSGNRNTKTEYNLVIEKDDFAYQIGEKLKSNGIIKNDTVWNWWMDKHYPKFTYINGEYNMTSSMSYEEIAKKRLQNFREYYILVNGEVWRRCDDLYFVLLKRRIHRRFPAGFRSSDGMQKYVSTSGKPCKLGAERGCRRRSAGFQVRTCAFAHTCGSIAAAHRIFTKKRKDTRET